VVGAAGVTAYVEVVVDVGDDAAEALTNFLWEQGAVGVVEETLLAGPARLRAFFPVTASTDALQLELRTIRVLRLCPELHAVEQHPGRSQGVRQRPPQGVELRTVENIDIRISSEQRRIQREEEAPGFDRAIFDVAFGELRRTRVNEIAMALNDVAGLLGEDRLELKTPELRDGLSAVVAAGQRGRQKA